MEDVIKKCIHDSINRKVRAAIFDRTYKIWVSVGPAIGLALTTFLVTAGFMHFTVVNTFLTLFSEISGSLIICEYMCNKRCKKIFGNSEKLEMMKKEIAAKNPEFQELLHTLEQIKSGDIVISEKASAKEENATNFMPIAPSKQYGTDLGKNRGR